MWGTLSACGRLSIGLGDRVQMPPRRVDNPPQVANLPHFNPPAHLSGLNSNVLAGLTVRNCIG